MRMNSSGPLGMPAARAVDFVHSCYTDPLLDLHKAANAVALSSWYLSRVLKEATGIGFARLLRQLRLARAEELLRTSSLNVKEVAASVGYSSTHTLDRNFKIVHGMTPTEYRRVARGESMSSTTTI